MQKIISVLIACSIYCSLQAQKTNFISEAKDTIHLTDVRGFLKNPINLSISPVADIKTVRQDLVGKIMKFKVQKDIAIGTKKLLQKGSIIQGKVLLAENNRFAIHFPSLTLDDGIEVKLLSANLKIKKNLSIRKKYEVKIYPSKQNHLLRYISSVINDNTTWIKLGK